MAGFVRRFTAFPPIEVLTEIEAIDIVDLPPPAPITGIGTGTLLAVGEYEDGSFAAGGDSDFWDGAAKGLGPQLVFSSEDLRQRFGGFGFQYGGLVHRNAASRRHLTELWNGNAFLKVKFLRPRRLIVARVDTSVGSVSFNALACISGGAGPFALTPAQTMSVTTDVGGPGASDAIAALVATAAGAAFVTPTLFAGGEQITIAIDGGPAVTVTFTAADQLVADVVARINLALGFVSAVVNVGQVDISGIVPGTSGSVVLADVTPGTLLTIGHAAGTTAGTGNVGNVNAVTATEMAVIFNGSAAWTAIDASATVDQNGVLRVCSDTGGIGTIFVASGPLATALGMDPVDTTVGAGTHAAGTVAAGTRVRDAGAVEWVTMQTLTIPEGTAAAGVGGPFIVKVRPALDDGSDAGTGAGTIVTIVDQPDWGNLEVTNPAALTAARTEPQMDVAYEAAFDATIDPNTEVRTVNHSLSARQSDALRTKGLTNALDASANGHFGRKFHGGGPLGFTQVQAQLQVALNRSDRFFYTWPGWRVRMPEIAAVGAVGGLGFTDSGIITVRSDGPLASINCQLPPEDNPGQQTLLIENFFELEQQPTPLRMSNYIALRAAGISAPRRDRVSGSIYQSGITSSLTAGLTTQARRKMADFIQDTIAEALIPESKKLNSQARRDAIDLKVESFMSELESANNPELARIDSFSVDETSGNTLATLARGIFVLILRARTLSSLDAIVLQTEIGEGVVIITELPA